MSRQWQGEGEYFNLDDNGREWQASGAYINEEASVGGLSIPVAMHYRYLMHVSLFIGMLPWLLG